MKKVIFLTNIVLLAAALPASADTLTLQDTMDTGFAAYDAGGFATNGKYGFMNADKGWTERRMLMQWDLSGIPAGATITSAVMRVYRASVSDGVPFSVYRVTSEWTEGHGMGNGNPGTGYGLEGANWTYRKVEGNDGIGKNAPGDSDEPLAWNTPGGDFDAASRVEFLGSTINDPATGFNWGLTATVTPIVQAWVNGQSNYGVIVTCDATEQVYPGADITYLPMRTRDTDYPDNGQDRPSPSVRAPQLVITYTGAPSLHPGDANGDGMIDLQDFGLLKDNFGIPIGGGATWAQGDFNKDGGVDLQDFGILKDHFGHSAGDPIVAIPEPATMSLLALAGLAMIRRNRK